MNDRGFSLIEILVALVLLAVCLLSVVPLFLLATRSSASANEISTLSALAGQRMELVRAIDFDLLAAGGSLTTNVAGFFDDSDPDFLLRWQITDDATPPTLKTIQVRGVALRNPIGMAKEMTLVGLVAQE